MAICDDLLVYRLLTFNDNSAWLALASSNVLATAIDITEIGWHHMAIPTCTADGVFNYWQLFSCRRATKYKVPTLAGCKRWLGGIFKESSRESI